MEEFVSVSKDFWDSYIEVIPESCCTCVSDVLYIRHWRHYPSIDLLICLLSHVYTQTHLWGIIFIYLNFKNLLVKGKNEKKQNIFKINFWIYKKSELTEILQE